MKISLLMGHRASTLDRLRLCTTAALVALAGSIALTAEASAVYISAPDLGPWSLDNSPSLSSYLQYQSVYNNSSVIPVTDVGTTAYQGTASYEGNIAEYNLSASVGFFPDPYVTVSGSGTLSGSDNSASTYWVSLQLSYQVQVSGPPNTEVPVTVSANGWGTATGGVGNPEIQAEMFIPGLSGFTPQSLPHSAPGQWSVNTTTEFNADQAYTVDLLVFGVLENDLGPAFNVYDSSSSFSATIDPTIKIASDFADADEYSIFFSPGIATTPLPASLPLFAGGLGTMSLLGWRRKRRNTSYKQPERLFRQPEPVLIRHTSSDCCARSASGHAAGATPSQV